MYENNPISFFHSPPFGSNMKERVIGGYRYGFNTQEKDPELGDYYAFEYRILDVRLGRFLSEDPLTRERESLTPYNLCSNNPTNRVDPTGALDDWVEDAQGNVTWNNNVTSANDKDLKIGEIYRGTEYRRFENIGSSTYDDVRYNSDKTINSTQRTRPDADGVVTQEESIDWYHFGGGTPLTVDISKFNFMSSKLSVEDFKTNSQSVDFFNGWSNHPFNSSIIWRPASDETLSDVYGTIRLAIVNRSLGTVRAVTDDATGFFDVFDYSNLGSVVGNRLRSNGNPTPFGFFGKGTGTIRKTTPKIIQPKIPIGPKW